MRFVTIIAALASFTGAFAAEIIATPRVALVYSDHGDFRHRDDYDAKMAALGWKLDKFENKDFATLIDRLDQVDIILGSALFNYSNVQDFSQYRDALFAFVVRGGAVVLSDTNYSQHVEWLGKCAPELAVTTENCEELGTPNEWMDATHPLFNIPNTIRKLGTTWAHMTPAEGWEVISRCEDGKATGLFRSIGRGYVLLTNHWGYSPEMLENLYGCQQCCRAGVFPSLPDLTTLDLGDNTLPVSIRNVTEEPVNAKVAIEVREPRRMRTYAAETSVGAGQTVQAEITVPLTDRGRHILVTHLSREGRDFFTSSPVELTIPELISLQVVEPRYRGSVYLAAPAPQVTCRVKLHPFEEKLEDLRVAATLTQEGETLGEVSAEASGREFSLTIPAQFSRVGEATLRADLLQEGKEDPIAAATVAIPVIEQRSPQVFIDDDLATRVDGQPFFPIGVYHVGNEDLPKAKALGFNCHQAWGSSIEQARENLDAAQQNGLMVLLEMSPMLRGTYRPDDFGALIKAVEDHPALLTWYTVDEPSGGDQLEWCRGAYQIAQELDAHHPVYLVMCNPGSFDIFGTTTDILAVDPYPIPNSVVMVSDWMKRAQEAVAGIKPIWIIPQLHNWDAYKDKTKGRGPTPEEERNMVYQGLIWGAKGVIYYPWDDGPTGLIHDPVLMEAVGKINSELEMIGPRLLECRHEIVAQNEGDLAGLYAAVYRSGQDTYVIAANVLSEDRDYEVPVPGAPDGEMDVLFESRSATLAAGAIRDTFGPLEVHVYHAR